MQLPLALVVATAATRPLQAGAHPSLHGLLGGFPVDGGAVAVDAALAAVVGLYAVGARRLRRKGRPWSSRTTAFFVAGIALVFVALGSGVARYDDVSFPAHMSQHVLLMMAAPPLLVLGRPVRLLAQASPRPVQLAVVHVANGRLARGLAGPFAWVLYFGSMWGYLLSPWYAATIDSNGLHEATHAIFLAVGLLYWESIIGGDGRRPVSPVTRGAGLMLGAPFESALGLVLMVRLRPMYGATLADTHAGGQLFWIEAMTVMGIALFATLWGWAREDERRRLARLERAATSLPASPTAPPAVERSATDAVLEEAKRVLRGAVADPGDMLIRPDEDEP